MKKATIFAGAAGSVKTRAAKDIAAQIEKKAVIFLLLRNRHCNKKMIAEQCNEFTKLLIIDEIISNRQIEAFFNFATDGITVNNRNSDTPLKITPQIILICQEGVKLPTGESFARRFDIVSFPIVK